LKSRIRVPAGASTATTAGRATRPANLQPTDYRRYMEALRPCVVQISGSEPLLRDDVAEIIRAIKSGDTLPYTILVSNWSEMTEGKYLALRNAGVDQFSVSLDFPDSRHDDFRL
jgi:MoaA/NifB/PqqE/SkfB family radical SAM enzyme